MMKVLVTGAAGYIGSVLCKELLYRGYEVLAVDYLRFGQTSLLYLFDNHHFQFFPYDVRDAGKMINLYKQADVIIPLAAIVGAPACNQDPWSAEEVNYGAIKLMINTLSKDQKVIFPNTNSGYGATDGSNYCTEETPINPISLYGTSKCRAERDLLEKSNAITLRLATVFGVSPRMRLDLLVNSFVYEAVTKGYLIIFEKEFKRNYVHIKDVAECFCHCITSFDKMKGEAYNLGLDSANLSKEELANKVKEYVPNLYIHFSEVGSDPDKRNYIVSSNKLKQKGFYAYHTLDEGIKQLISAYQILGRKPHSNV